MAAASSEPSSRGTDSVLLLKIDAVPQGRARAQARRDTDGRRAAIAHAATELFLRQGYVATSTEQIATAATVSKQTVYNQFGDKQSLFRAIVLGVTANAEQFAVDLGGSMDDVATAGELERALRALAHRYLGIVLSPQVLALRRLVISEAMRFPELAAEYYTRGPERVMAGLAALFGDLRDRGLLQTTDPDRAAGDFAFLLLGRALDEEMFRSRNRGDDDVAAIADHGVDCFLACYGGHG